MKVTITIPTPAALLRRSRWLIFGLLVLAVAVTWGHESAEPAEAAGPGMAITGPATVEVGQKFTIGLETNPSPSVDFSGFPAEILVPTGLKYNGTNNCAAEVKVTIGGFPPELCFSIVPSVGGGILLAVLSQASATPAALDQSVPSTAGIGLANLSYTCNAAGTYTVLLTDGASSLDGAEYFDTLAGVIPVKTIANPIGPGTVADALVIDCVETLKSEINILKQNVQVLLPDSCFEVRDAANIVALFTVCDNDFQGVSSHPVCNADGTPACEDSDPADGSIRVSVDPGNYNVVEVKPPPGHVLNTSKLPCDAKTAKCDLVFKNASISNPWFPWDLTGDGAVAFADFLAVLQHFNTQKP